MTTLRTLREPDAKRPLTAAIIGYGKIGMIRHRCLSGSDKVRLIGICDTDPARRPKGRVPFYRTYTGLLAKKPDIVMICTYNCFIPEIACAAISRGIHVFAEKPAGTSARDALRIHNAWKKNRGVKVKFGFNHRYHEAVQEARSLVVKGRLGKVLWMRGIYGKGGGPSYDTNWRNNAHLSGGGILIDQGIHMVDLFRYFCGEFNEVKSYLSRSYWPVSVEDNVFALLRNRNGQVAMLHSSATQWKYHFHLDIYLQKGYLTLSGILSSTNNYAPETLRIARCQYDSRGYPLPNPEETITHYTQDTSWQREWEDLIASIRTGTPITTGSSYDAYQTMRLIEKIYREAKSTGRSGGRKP